MKTLKWLVIFHISGCNEEHIHAAFAYKADAEAYAKQKRITSTYAWFVTEAK